MRMWQRGQTDPSNDPHAGVGPPDAAGDDSPASAGQPGESGVDPVGSKPASEGPYSVLDALTGLESQLAQLRRAHELQQQTAAELEARRAALAEERAEVDRLRSEAELERSALEERSEAVAQRAADVEAELERAREAAEVARAQSEALEARERGLSERETAVDQARAEADAQALEALAQAERRVETLVGEVEARRGDIERLAEELGAVRARVDELESVSRALSERAERAESEAASARSEAESLAGRARDAEARLGEMERARAEAGERAEAAERALGEARELASATAGDAEAQVREAVSRAGALEGELNEARSQVEALASRASEAESRAESLAARLSEAEASARDAGERVLGLERELEEARASGDGSGGSEAESALLERLKAAEADAADARADYETLRSKAKEMAAALDRRTKRLRQAETRLSEIDAGGGGASGGDGSLNAVRRERLRRQRDLLRAESSKIRRAAEALRQKFAEADRVLAQRAELRTAARAVVEAQKKLQREKATTRAVWNIAGIALAVAAIGALSFSLVKQVVPGQYAAVATFKADARGREATPEELEGWRVYHEALIEDPRFVQTVAQRMGRRGLAELSDLVVLREAMGSRLDQQAAGDDSFEVQWIGTGSARTERELDTLFSAIVSEANAARKHRPDGLLTVVESPATAGADPIDRSQLMIGLMVFGGLAFVAVVSGLFVWRRMSRARDDFERELRVVAALGDVESIDPR